MLDVFGGGSQSSTTQVNVPPPTAAELELQKVNLAVAQVLFDQLVTTSNLQNNVLLPLFAEQAGIILERAPAAPAGATTAPGTAAPTAAPAAPTSLSFAAAQSIAEQQLLEGQSVEDISGGGTPRASPNDVRRVQGQFLAGNADVLRLAAKRGITPTPSPSTAVAPTPTGPAPGSITGFSLTPEAQERLGLSQQVQTAGLKAQLAATESAQALAQTLIEETPEFSMEDALAFIDAAAESAIASGSNEIQRFQSLALESLREELAPSLGLRSSDTPILDRGARVAEESTRQQGQLVRGVTTTSEQLKADVQKFQASLAQSAFVNRSNLLGTLGNFGLGFPSAPSPGATVAPAGTFGLSLAQSGIPGAELQASLADQRLRTASKTQTISGGGDVAGGISGLAIGLGTLGFNPFATAGAGIGAASAGTLAGVAAADVALFPAIFSSRELKRDPERSESGMRDITHEVTLEKLEDLPVERWRYKEGLGLGDRDHIGVYAEDFKETFNLGDGKTIHLLDAVGVGLSATKGLARKVRLLEHAAHGA